MGRFYKHAHIQLGNQFVGGEIDVNIEWGFDLRIYSRKRSFSVSWRNRAHHEAEAKARQRIYAGEDQ